MHRGIPTAARQRIIATAVAVVGAAAAVVVLGVRGGTRRVESPETPRVLPASSPPPQVGTTVAATSLPSSTVDVTPSDSPGVLGGRTLVALTGQRPFTLHVGRIGDGAPTSRTVDGAWVRAVGFDFGGALFALLSSRPGDDAALMVGPVESQYLLADRVGSAAWSRDEAGRIAWVRLGSDGHDLMVGRVRTSAALSDVRRIVGLSDDVTLVGWSSRGFLLWRPDERSRGPVAFWLDSAGRRLGNVAAQRAWMDTADSALVAVGDPARRFIHARAPFTAWEVVVGAPAGAVAEYDFAAISHLEPLRYAFIVPESSSAYRLVIIAPETDTPTEVGIPYRVWDVMWSRNDGLVVMPGTDDGGSHFAVIYEVASGTLSTIEFDDWLQYVEII